MLWQNLKWQRNLPFPKGKTSVNVYLNYILSKLRNGKRKMENKFQQVFVRFSWWQSLLIQRPQKYFYIMAKTWNAKKISHFQTVKPLSMSIYLNSIKAKEQEKETGRQISTSFCALFLKAVTPNTATPEVISSV